MENENIIRKVEKLLNIASDFTRLKIMNALLDESKCTCTCDSCGSCRHRHCMIEKCVGDICNEIGASQSLVSHQLKVLKNANLIDSRKEGNRVFYFLKDGHIKDLLRIATDHVMEEG
ncbi:MAG: metalloregulator ArsR/SmtB family transcription factor [Bacilli bacterium]|nr:metalloregulator ArsR/SmtB family transcription factor [Bacilli bacterium]